MKISTRTQPSSRPSSNFSAVVHANVRHGRLIATMVDSGYEAFLLNWVTGLRALGLTEFVIVALDQPIWSLLGEAGLRSHAVHFGLPSPNGKARADRQRAASWYDERYRRLMGSVPQRLLSLFGAGEFDLLLTDADVLWRRSPWPVLYDPRRAECELLAIEGHGSGPPTPSAAASLAAEPEREAVVSGPATVRERHPQANCATCLNAGFLLLRRSPRVSELLRRWSATLASLRGADHNQKWLNWLLATGGALHMHCIVHCIVHCVVYCQCTAYALHRALHRAHQCAHHCAHHWLNPTAGMRVGSDAAAALYANGTGGWAAAPRACRLPPSRFANGAPLRTLLPLLPAPLHTNCSCGRTATATGARGGGSGGGGGGGGVGVGRARACAARRGALTAQLHAAHLNFALSAGEKVCLAKALGLWLLSAQHRHAFDSVPADAVADAVRSLGRVAAVTEMEADEGRVVAPQESRERSLGSEKSPPVPRLYVMPERVWARMGRAGQAHKTKLG